MRGRPISHRFYHECTAYLFGLLELAGKERVYFRIQSFGKFSTRMAGGAEFQNIVGGGPSERVAVAHHGAAAKFLLQRACLAADRLHRQHSLGRRPVVVRAVGRIVG